MTYASADPAALLADKGWRRRHSAWMLAVIFGGGAFSFVGFVYTAFRVKSKKFWIVAAASAVASALAMVALETMPPADSDGTVQGGDWQTLGLFAIWIGMIVFGVYHNRDYLRWRADPVKTRQWYEQQNVGSHRGLAPAPDLAQGGYPQIPSVAQPPNAPATGPVAGIGVDTSQYYAPTSQPAPTVAGPRSIAPPPYQPPASPVPSAEPVGPVDVNSATAEQLSAALRGERPLTARILAAREARGGFTSLDDLVSSARLQPHELMKVRGKVSFGQPRAPLSEPQRGAAQQNPPSQGPPDDGVGRGRILDF